MEQKEGDKEGGRLIKESQTLYVAASLSTFNPMSVKTIFCFRCRLLQQKSC